MQIPKFKNVTRLLVSAVAICQALLLATSSVHAAPPGPLTLSQSPLFFGAQQKPIVMLNLTKDHQLHFKAYTDYSDLDGDGKPDLTYKHSFNYYGYWDSGKCYSYVTSNGNSYFSPIGFSADKYCDGTGWSGNFLNWVATSRLDSVRKILYGGKRSTDTASNTILERSFLTMDAHSWAKFYDGADLKKLIPVAVIGTFTVSASGTTYATLTSVAPAATSMNTTGDFFVVSAVSARVGDQIKLTQTVNEEVGGVVRYARVTAISNSTPPRLTLNIPNATVGVLGATDATTLTSTWQLENLSATGVTFCNTTFVNNGNSTTANAPPLIRISRGNTELWAANERWQCGFQGEKASNSGGGFTAGGQNGNYFPLSGLRSNAESPPNNTTYKFADYTARVQACVDQTSAADTTAIWSKRESCKQYGSQWKPVGLLQKQDGFKFGLFTGSYAKNISGGVLRSNVGDFSLEVDANGVFVDPTTNATLAAKGSIVKAIDAIRMTGYDYADGTYIGYDGNCTFQLIDLVPSGATGNKRNQGACSSWGNPIAEMYTESLRYLAGASADSNFTYTSAGSIDAALGMSIITWADPINNNNYCVPLKNIIFNAATTSYDGDQVNMASLAGVGTNTAASFTDIVGDATHEAIITGIAGKINGALPSSALFNSCTDKTGTLSTLRGICPEGAPYSGSYLTAGSAYYARNNKIRTSPAIPASSATLFPDAYTVETFGVSLANNTPKIDILSQDLKTVRGTITPAYRLDKGDGIGGGTIVDFKIIKAPDFSQENVTGRYYINWEDSGFGGDFDQDVIGDISFEFNQTSGLLKVTTAATNASTANAQGFGYVLTGSTSAANNGPHFHSGILTFNYTSADGTVECTNCQAGQSPTSRTYTIGTVAVSSLKDPLYYAAKWGAVKDTGNALALFDKKGAKDIVTGNDLPDGIPDNYFNVANPAKLVEQLEALFAGISAGSSSSSAAASTTRASSDTLAFTASFTGATWGGALKAFSLDVGPPIVFNEEWDAALKLNLRTTARNIFTTNDNSRTGQPFAWANLSSSQQTGLGATTLIGQSVLNYIAGDRTNEGTAPGSLRVRTPSVLGDIISSNPTYSSDKADFSATFSGLPGYANFFKQFDTRQGGTKRTRAIYVGANDGMLHAFVGDSKVNNGGDELFAYVPSMVFNKLPLLTQQSYTTFGNHQYTVDGSPVVSDANTGTATVPAWKTVLVSGLGAGGAGFFALDVTRPESMDVTKVMWEFKASDALRTSLSDLGASTGEARIARSNLGGETWFAVFGNGYNSTITPTNGNAVLFAAKLGKGTGGWTENSDFYRLVLSNDTDNGLSTPTLVDYNRTGFVDFIYAGDLQGNLWRIDVRNPLASGWSAKKLFKTQSGQPITTAPQVTRHPNGGLMIMFGTGKYLEATDVSVKPPVQSMYGIIDLDPNATTTVTQSIADLNAVTATNRTLSTGGSCSNVKGWYTDLRLNATAAGLEGERSVFESALIAGTLFAPTLVPSSDLCFGGGKSYLYSFNPFTGCAADPLKPIADESAGIQSTPRFIAISPAPIGRNDTTGGGRSLEVDADGRQTTKLKVILLGNAEGKPVSIGGNNGRDLTVSSGRLSWREIVDQ